MHNEGWGAFRIFLEDIGRSFHYEKVSDRGLALRMSRNSLPYGSGAFFPAWCAWSVAAVLVTGRPERED